MNILVTGGCGYIGSVAVKKLLKKDYNVIVVDDLSTGSLEAIKGLDVKLYQVDIRNKEELLTVFKKEKIDFVMDFAAKLIVEESVQNPELYYDVNVIGLKNVLDCMVETEVKKIIFSSTAAVYGMLDKKDKLIDENDQVCPINPYGTTKLIGEFMVQDYAKKYNIEFLIFRYFNVVGSVKYGAKLSDITTIVPVIINAINENKKMYINGNDYSTKDGTCIRDFIHLEDLVNAHIVGMENLNKENSGIYNLSIGTGTSILELIDLTNKELNVDVKYEIGPRREGDPVVSAATNLKFLSNFDWKIEYTNIGEMIKETFFAWKEYLKK